MAQDIPWEEQSSGGKKVYRVKQSQSCYLSSCFGRCSGEVVTSVIIGQDKQVIVAWPVSCLVGLCCFLGQFQSLVLKGLSSVPTFLDSKVAGSRAEWLRAKTTIQNGNRCQAFLLFLVNLWAQVRSQCFSAKKKKSNLSTPYMVSAQVCIITSLQIMMIVPNT
jgi:hypothetical protein